MYTVKFPVMAATSLAVVAAGCLLLMAQEPAQAPVATGRGGGRGGGRGASGTAGRGRAAGGSPDGFSQFIRPLASQDVLLRGKTLYDANCAGCHAADMRGVTGKGNNLLRSPVAMDDQHGELIIATLANPAQHNPPVTLVEADGVAASEYIHSVLATMGSQGSPPGRNPVGLQLKVLVGDPQAGKVYFDGHCASCHSITGDLKGSGSKYGDDRALQNAWVAGSGGDGGRGGRGGRGGNATVTMANGQKIEGALEHEDDFLVILKLADGTRRSIPIDNGVPKVETPDPQAAHKKMVLELDDPQNKNMHDVTAYLATLK